MSEFLTLREAARLLRVSERTLWTLLRRPDGPPAVDLSLPGAKRRLLRFRREALLAWLGEREKGAAPPERPLSEN